MSTSIRQVTPARASAVWAFDKVVPLKNKFSFDLDGGGGRVLSYLFFMWVMSSLFCIFQGTSDPRGVVAFKLVKYISMHHPGSFILENVKDQWHCNQLNMCSELQLLPNHH